MTTELPGLDRPDPLPVVPTGSLYEREFWAIQRHELVAGAADELLSPHAKQAVRKILAPIGLVGLADVAGWADTVKRRRPDPVNDDSETLTFLEDTRNERNDRWHYVNLPLGAEGYDREQYAAFTRPDDVVSMTAESVRVLLGQSSRFSVVNALRLVAHLVGDVHQPIHVGCCYLKLTGKYASLVRGPDQAADEGLESDEGGNRLFLPLQGGSVKLHAYWDGALSLDGVHVHDTDVDHDDDAMSPNAHVGDAPPREWLISKLVNMVKESADPDGIRVPMITTTLQLDRLAEGWATDSLIAARAAYASLRISGRHDERSFDVTWEGQADYDARCKPIVERRLANASRNLAMLANAIWP